MKSASYSSSSNLGPKLTLKRVRLEDVDHSCIYVDEKLIWSAQTKDVRRLCKLLLDAKEEPET
jgi:hypothetical protein